MYEKGLKRYRKQNKKLTTLTELLKEVNKKNGRGDK